MNSGDITKNAESYSPPGDDVVRCSHCDFTSDSTSSMTQHRWDVHPLLARRKQHLMKTSPKVLKRPSSQPSSQHDKSIADDATPSKQLSLYDVTKDKRSASLKDEGVYSMEAFAKEFHSIEKKTKPSRPTSPGETSSQRNHNSRRSAKLPHVDGIAIAPQASRHNQNVTEYIASLVKNSPASHADVALRPLFMDQTLSFSPRGVANDAFVEKPQHLSKNNPHHGNFAPSSSFWASSGSRDKLRFSENSVLGASSSSTGCAPTKAIDSNRIGGAFSLYTLDSKSPHGYITNPTSGMQFPVNPLSVIPYSLAGLSPSTYIPTPRNNHFLHHSLYQTAAPPFLPGSLPLHMLSGVPLCISSSTSDDIVQRRYDVTMDAILSIPKSQKVATYPNEKSQLDEKKQFSSRMTPRDSHTLLPGTNVGESHSAQKTQENKSKSANRASLARALAHPSPPSHQALENNVSFRAAQRQSGNEGVFSESCFPSSSSISPKKSSKTSYPCSTLSQQRPLVAVQVMDNDRVKVLEAALRNTDCCDPNERSSILPFRCSDGKWRMVRTKRIGAVWLVQFPDCKEPSIYLPNLNRVNKTENTLNNWLKEKLGSFKGNFVSPKSEGSCWMNNRQRASESIHQRTGSSSISSASINEAHNEAIRNLLLQKPALV